MTLRVAELFRSLQGEGPSAGTPAHFLRLQGCDVGCTWCDTKYSWDATQGRASTIAEAFSGLRALGDAPLLVVTGGEPLAHPGVDRLLTAALGQWPRVGQPGQAPPAVRVGAAHPGRCQPGQLGRYLTVKQPTSAR